MNKEDLLLQLTNKINSLEINDLLQVNQYIDYLDYSNNRNNAIDKETILQLLQEKGFADFKALAIHLMEAKLYRGPMGGYHGRGAVIEWLKFQLDCSDIQAEKMIRLMSTFGLIIVSSYNNVKVNEVSLK